MPFRSQLPAPLLTKLEALETILKGHAPLLIAYSGGVDSACLLALAQRFVPGGFLGVIADSPSLPRRSLEEALTLAASLEAPVEVVRTKEMDNPDYASNPLNRCYFCKAELFITMEALAIQRQFSSLAYGENADDQAQLRPGSRAAQEFSVVAPLKAAGLTKAEIREISRALDLPTADAPAQPCLSSRILHGTPVTPEALWMVEKGEEWVRSLGFRVFRVRHIRHTTPPGGVSLRARVQIAPAEMHEHFEQRQAEIEGGLRAIGYGEVEIDPQGYRTA